MSASLSAFGSHGIYIYMPFSLLRSSYNPLGAGSSRRPPSGAMGIPPAGARAPYRAPTGKVLITFIMLLIPLFITRFYLAHFISDRNGKSVSMT